MADFGRVTRKLRAAIIQKLATAVETFHRRLSVDELFQLCASTTPSTTGTVFYGDYFYAMYSAHGVYFGMCDSASGGISV